MNSLETFKPGMNDVPATVVASWGDGPLCECNSWEYDKRLPNEAWRYTSVEGQFVVAPGHQEPGVRIVEKDGFVIEEDDTYATG